MRPGGGPGWWEDGHDDGRGYGAPGQRPPGPPPTRTGPPPGPPPTRSGPPGWRVPPQGPPGPPAGGPPPRRRRPARRLRLPGAGGLVGALVVAGLAVVVLFPETLGLDARSPFAQVVAFRPQLAGAAVVLAALAGLGAWTRRSGPDALLVALALGLVGTVALRHRGRPGDRVVAGRRRR